ncbi:MFS transporter [Paenibacillus tarimensis]
MNRIKLASNLPLFFVYKFLNSFILDRGIWMLFLVSKGFSLAEIALIETAYHCTIFLLEVPTGYIADRYGKRVSLLLAECAGVLSASLLLWGENAAVIIAGFILGGLVGTFQSGATGAMIFETLKALGKEAAFKRYNSHLSAVVLLTMGVSGAAGGALSDIDWMWVYAGKVILHVLTLAIILLLVEPVPEESGKPDPSSGGATSYSFMRQITEGSRFMKINVSFFSLCLFGAILYSMSWSVSFYSQVVFQSIGLGNPIIGMLNGLETWVSAGIAAVAFLGERKLGKQGSLFISGVGFIVFLVIFAIKPSVEHVIAAFFMMSVCISYLEPLMEAYLNELLPSHMRATMLSFFSMMISAGMMMTFSFIGFLADRTDLSTALKYVLLIWIPICLATMLWSLRHAKKDESGRRGNEK